MTKQSGTMDKELVRPIAASVLIVDDDAGDRIGAKRLLTKNPEIQDPIEIYEAASIPEALRLIAQHPIDVVLLDKNVGQNFGDVTQDGIESIPEMLNIRQTLCILVVTGSDDPEDVMRASKFGALGYLVKGGSKEKMQHKVAEAIRKARANLQEIIKSRLTNPDPQKTQVQLGGHSTKWKRAVSKALLFSPSRLPVLINGPTGCGKTELARLIHCERRRLNPDAARTFVEINIAAISAELAERELFGNEKGAYTGAVVQKAGYFELANRGTLFMDEIGDADLDLQKKILKVVEDGRFYRLGGSEVFQSSFKLICATHRDLKAMVAKGLFREDLYMRISTLELPVPSLAERKEDVPDIVRAMLPRVCELVGCSLSFDDLPESFIAYLLETSFDGNARGIWQQVARLLVLAPSGREGKKVLTNWRRVLEIDVDRSVDVPVRGVITLHDLLHLPFDIIGPEFSGISDVMDTVQDRIYGEAKRKFQTNNAIARALNVTTSTASVNLRRIEKRISKPTPSVPHSLSEKALSVQSKKRRSLS